MSVITELAPAPTPEHTLTTKPGDDLNHWWCCDPNVALCGTDISDHPFWDGVEIDLSGECVVCIDLVDSSSYRCGPNCDIHRYD